MLVLPGVLFAAAFLLVVAFLVAISALVFYTFGD